MAAEGRREMIAKTAGAFGLIAGAGAASADGAVSTTTVARARGIYGSRILALEDAVAKGNLAAVAEEKNAFILFCSGVYTRKGAKEAALKAKAVAASDALLAAVEKGDTAGAKAAYKEFLSVAAIAKPYEGKDKAYSQGYSTEYDWKYKTPKGTIYVR
mmetsp:Transcript_66021/g.148999  ORF Transcript_66021/g.148999 Transcript_66021/m.148999 type:complete len:158 (+) Transcript_66021:254-727(+)